VTERAKGIDVSHYQGKIDWEAVAQADITFAFIKATDGCNCVDPMFNMNWSNAGVAGIQRGAYHFFRAQQDPKQQAANFLSTTGHCAPELPPVLDFESLAGMTVEQALRNAHIWMDIVKTETGLLPILYTGPSFWRDALKNNDEFARHPLWIAHYTSAAEPIFPTAWNQWMFWQHSEKGCVAGIKGPVDLNWFRGNATELPGFCTRISKQQEKATGAAVSFEDRNCFRAGPNVT
jgi:lysozyme